MKKKKKGPLFTLSLLFLLLYFLFFPAGLRRETVIRPIWMVDLKTAKAVDRGAGTKPFSWFRAGDQFGYIDREGRLLSMSPVLYQVALSEAGFINYGSQVRHLLFMNPRAEMQFGLETNGYPLLDAQGQRILEVSTDRTALKERSRDGEVLWNLEFLSPMTGVSLSSEDTAVGLLSGRFLLVNRQGIVIQNAAAEGSRIPIILGTALNGDGRLAAMISGIDPAFLTVWSRSSGTFSTIHRMRISGDFRQEARIFFSTDDRFLVFEDGSGLGVLSLPGRSQWEIPFPGGIRALGEAAGYLTAIVSGRPADHFFLLRLPRKLLHREILGIRPVAIRQKERCLLMGLPGSLLRADLVEN